MYFVYVLKSRKDGNYYWGYTNDVKKRLREHNLVMVKSTRYRRPLVLFGTKEFKSRKEARWYEYSLKNHGDRKKKLLKELEEASGSERW